MVDVLTSGVTIDLSEFDVPGRGRGILDVFRRKYLLHLLIRKGTATRYRNSVLGWVWSYVKPAAQFVIYYFVMGVIMQMDRGIENFPVYLISGVVAGDLFIEAFANLYGDYAEQIEAKRERRAPDALSLLAPTGADGVDALAFVDAVLKSGLADGSWVALE